MWPMNLLSRPSLIELAGYAASLSVFASFCMTTMVPLRATALLSNVLFITYGYFGRVYPVLALHLALLPVNIWRITQVVRLIGATRHAPEGFDFSVLRPLMAARRLRAGEILFRRGDPAAEMFLLESGELAIQENGLVRKAGAIIGEMGVLSHTSRRTATVVARTDCMLRALTAARLRELYFQYPGLTLYLMETLADRLIPHVQAPPGAEPDGLEGRPVVAPHSPLQ